MQRTPLSILLQYQNNAKVDEIMQFFSSGAFYSRGLNINTDLRDKNTLLHFAVKFGHVALTKALLNHSQIKCDIKNNDEETSFHIAASAKLGSPDILKMLIEKSPGTINCQNTNGLSPLHYAILTENTKNMITLLDNNADTKIKDHKGNCSLHAAKHGYYSIVKYIDSLDKTIVANDPSIQQFLDEKSDQIEKISAAMNSCFKKDAVSVRTN